MATQTKPTQLARAGGSTSIADVLDRILDKGLVIDVWVQVSLVGLELLTIEARVVVASVETYLRYADAIAKMGLISPPRRPLAREPEPPVLERPPEQGRLPSGQELQQYLEDHEEGMSLDELAEHFSAPREELAERLRRLESEGSVLQTERQPS